MASLSGGWLFRTRVVACRPGLAPAAERPDAHADSSDRHEDPDLVPVELPQQDLDPVTEKVACSRDDRRPENPAEDIQDEEPSCGVPRHSDDDRTSNPDPVHEPEEEDEDRSAPVEKI